MNKKFLSAILFGALMVASTGTFVSCKDYDDDIENLQEQINAQKSDLSGQLAALNTALTAAQSEITAAKQAAADADAKAVAAAAAADAAAEAAAKAESLAATAKEAAATAKAEAIEKAIELVDDLKADLAGKVDQTVYDAKMQELGEQISAIDTKLNKINASQIDENKSAIAQLQTQMTAVEKYKELIDTKANASDFADEKERVNGLIETINETIATLATSADVATQISNVSEKVAAVQAELVTLLDGALRSLVFIPELYVDGIEATEYTYLGANLYSKASQDHRGQLADGTPYFIEGGNVPWIYNDGTICEHAQNSATGGTNGTGGGTSGTGGGTNGTGGGTNGTGGGTNGGTGGGTGAQTYAWYYEPVWTVKYHLNPSGAKVEKDDLSFISEDAEFVKTRVSAAGPVVTDCATANGELTVSYKLSDAKTFAEVVVENQEYPVMALNAVVKKSEEGNATVTSDYATLYPSIVVPQAIAYTYTDIDAKEACSNTNAGEHLYTNACDALMNPATIKVEYNDVNGVDLKEYLAIHYNQSNPGGIGHTNSVGTHKVWEAKSAEEAQYGLKYEFYLVEFTLGSNGTWENKYGEIGKEEGVFYPRYVDNSGNSQAPTGEPNSGVSAIGRTPIVCVVVKGVDADQNKAVLCGYVKLEIVRNIQPVTAPVFDLGKQAYVCGTKDKQITWSEMSNSLLEIAAVTSKAEFDQLYTLTRNNAGDIQIYGANKTALTVNDKYGTVTLTSNAGSTTNDVIKWTTTQAQRDAIYAEDGHKVTIYVRYNALNTLSASALPMIYVPLTLEVVKPEVTYGEKIDEYWYGEGDNTQRLNVVYPNNGGSTMPYAVNLDNAFVGNTIRFSLENNGEGLFNEWISYEDYPANRLISTAVAKYKYFFTATNNGMQYTVDGTTYTFSVSADRLTLKVGNNEIAKLSGAHNELITYQNNAVAKKLLNAWTHDDANNAYIAHVGFEAVAGTCEIPLITEEFDVRFLRPIDVEGKSGVEFTDAQANGSEISIFDALNFTDWRNQSFAGANAWYFAFYNVTSVEMDKANITTTMNNGTLGETKLSTISTNVKFELLPDADADNVNTFNLSAHNNATALQTTVANAVKAAMGTIKYTNNGNNVQSFKVRIPIKVTYDWGTIETYVDCDVKNTLGN